MTRKDYELLAEVLSNLNDDFNNGGSDEVSLALVAGNIANALQLENPRFDRLRFLVACGVMN